MHHHHQRCIYISTKAVQAIFPSIPGPLTKLINISFEKGKFPRSLKTARVIALAITQGWKQIGICIATKNTLQVKSSCTGYFDVFETSLESKDMLALHKVGKSFHFSIMITTN